MGILDKLFGDSTGRQIKPENKKPDITKLIATGDIEESMNELDTYICELCNFGDNINLLNEPQKNFYLIQTFEREMDNGGFSQFFFTSSGDYSHETVKSLRVAGADDMAELLLRSFEQFPDKTVVADRRSRQEILEQIEENAEENWGKLELEFYKREPKLTVVLWEYVKQNRSFF